MRVIFIDIQLRSLAVQNSLFGKPVLFGQCRSSPRDYYNTDAYVIDHVIVTFACLKNRYAGIAQSIQSLNTFFAHHYPSAHQLRFSYQFQYPYFLDVLYHTLCDI